MSPPTSGAQPTGHAARAVISTKRRVQIWDQFYISFKETIPPHQWCTRQELVDAACGGKTGIKFTVDELTEVIRGRKHKREAGIDSQKVNGEWLYRFIPPGTKAPASKLPSASPPSAKTKPKPKPKTKTTPKRPTARKSTAPGRPGPKGPAAKTPPPRPAAEKKAEKAEKATAAKEEAPLPVSRKRASPLPPAEAANRSLRPGPKKPRLSFPEALTNGNPGPGEGSKKVNQQSGVGGDCEATPEMSGGVSKFGGEAGVGAGGSQEERGGWGCAVM